MVPVFAVNVHVGSSYAFIMESGSFNEIQRSLIVRQDERFYAVHLILIENKRYGGIQRLCHVSLTGVVLVQMIADAAAHHAAVSKIEKGECNIKFLTLVALMKSLDIPFENLFDIKSLSQ